MSAIDVAKNILCCFAGIYKRSACSPHYFENALERITHLVEQQKPVQFVKFWGKGERDLPGTPELEGIGFLGKLFKRVEAQWKPAENIPGYNINVVFADNHIINNGFSDGMETYFQHTIQAMKTEGLQIKASFLSDYYQPPKPDELLELARQQTIDPDLFNLITTRAMKHNTRLPSHRDSAMIYHYLATQEAPLVARAHTDAVFLTYNGYDSLPIMPDMPMIFLNSYKGKTHKPWFI